MKTYRFIQNILLLPACAVLAACGGDEERFDEFGKYAFEIDYVNHAWIETHIGLVITANGEVWSYDIAAAGEQFEIRNLVEDENYVPGSLLRKKYDYMPAYLEMMDAEVMSTMLAKVPEAADGELSEPEHVRTDAGRCQLNAWRYDPMTDTYRKITLREEGNFRIINDSQAARDLVIWLEEVASIYPIGGLFDFRECSTRDAA